MWAMHDAGGQPRDVAGVNWCEVTITDEATGELLYRNAWATDHALTESGLHDFVIAARTHWKSENENNTCAAVLPQRAQELRLPSGA